mmetsp:Transcript_4821/g.6703  ORF Transcript_4821/g.6703 Transcript_4821/m.6703 type:complete len:246 (-) Transcript_4821:373-1110(-)
MVPLWLEVLLISLSYAMTVGFLLLSVVARGSRWMYGHNALLRKRWTKRMLSREADALALLGVQTYRNVIMSSSFLATAVLGVSSFFLNTVFSNDETEMITKISLNDPLTSVDPETGLPYISVTVKLMILFIICFVAFFFMTQSIRLHMHLGFAMKANTGDEITDDIRERTMSSAVLGQSYFAFGLRVFYLLFPSVLWLLGTMWLVIGSTFTTVGLFVFDTNHDNWGKRFSVSAHNGGLDAVLNEL